MEHALLDDIAGDIGPPEGFKAAMQFFEPRDNSVDWAAVDVDHASAKEIRIRACCTDHVIAVREKRDAQRQFIWMSVGIRSRARMTVVGERHDLRELYAEMI